MPKFGHLRRYDTATREATYTLPFKGPPQTLRMRCAGQSNKPYIDAVARATAKSGSARVVAQGRIDSNWVDQNRKQDRELFPKHVIVGWDGIRDESGAIVPFSVEACRELLDAVPDWIMDDLRNFAAAPGNFLDEDTPTDGEVREQAGN